MKPIVLSIAASLFVLGLGLSPFATATAAQDAPLIEGTDHPILLARMVVVAPPLPGQLD